MSCRGSMTQLAEMTINGIHVRFTRELDFICHLRRARNAKDRAAMLLTQAIGGPFPLRPICWGDWHFGLQSKASGEGCKSSLIGMSKSLDSYTLTIPEKLSQLPYSCAANPPREWSRTCRHSVCRQACNAMECDSESSQPIKHAQRAERGILCRKRFTGGAVRRRFWL